MLWWYVRTSLVVVIVCMSMYAIISLTINKTRNYILRTNERERNNGYCKGYSIGYKKGVVAGREEGQRTAMIVDINARATVNEIRQAYGFKPSEYLDNLYQSGVITEGEFVEGKSKLRGTENE